MTELEKFVVEVMQHNIDVAIMIAKAAVQFQEDCPDWIEALANLNDKDAIDEIRALMEAEEDENDGN